MRRDRRAGRRLLPIIAAIAVAGPSAYAFTASNTVPGSNAGAGSGNVTGYAASSISYALNGTTPTNIDAVTFAISPTNGVVKVRLSPAGAWYACSNVAGSVSCGTTSPQATVDTVTQLTVVAAQ
jgi:hypothetical protein